MIQRVEFRNFKGLRQVELDLERFTVLVGPNASGKTSILEGIYYLLCGHQPQVTSFFEHVDNFYTRGATGSIELALEAGDLNFKVELSPSGPFSDTGCHEPPTHKLPPGWSYRFFGSKSANGQWVFGGTYPVDTARFGAPFLRLDARRLASPSFSREAEPRVGQDGKGLASALAYMRLNRPKDFDQLLSLLRMVCPYVEGIRFNRVETYKVETGINVQIWGEEIILDIQGAPNIPARMVSDGTLLVLGLLAVMTGPDRPKLLLLDDLDHGLHPQAQRDLVVLLRRLFEQDPELQIVATSHSPYLLDELDPKEVRLTTRREDGSVACARLDEHPDFEKWKEAMRPGEFWSMVGEKWVGERQLEATGS